jgi:RNA polymerase subunit RPABC4/transcription elongation factor Spt4
MSENAPEPGRMAQAHRIAANPSAFKICEGCDSIVAASVAMCPNCHSYRFDAEAQRVVEQAMRIGAREQRSVTAEDLS